MGAATIEAIATGRAALSAATGDRFAIGEQLLSAVGILAGSPALRTAIADAAADGAAKTKVVDSVFSSALAGTRSVLRAAATSRWSSQDDLLTGIEELGIRAVAASAPASVSIADELAAFGKAVSADADLEFAVGSTLVDGVAKAKVVAKLVSGQVSKQTVQILTALVGQSRGRRIGELIARATSLVADEAGRVVATVQTATPLTAAQKQRLVVSLSHTAGHDVTINEVVDPSVIGGVRVVLGDRVIDGTVSSKLAALRLALAGQPA